MSSSTLIIVLVNSSEDVFSVCLYFSSSSQFSSSAPSDSAWPLLNFFFLSSFDADLHAFEVALLISVRISSLLNVGMSIALHDLCDVGSYLHHPQTYKFVELTCSAYDRRRFQVFVLIVINTRISIDAFEVVARLFLLTVSGLDLIGGVTGLTLLQHYRSRNETSASDTSLERVSAKPANSFITYPRQD